MKPSCPCILIFAGGITGASFADAEVCVEAGLLVDQVPTDLTNMVVYSSGPRGSTSRVRASLEAATGAAGGDAAARRDSDLNTRCGRSEGSWT